MKINYSIKLLMLCIGLLVISKVGFAQEDTAVVPTVTEDEGKLPVRSPWNASMIIDNQTTETPSAKSFEITIHHRFGNTVDIADLYGIYAASNIRLGVNYGITDKIDIGFGTEKDHKMQEFQGKYKIISQSRNGKIPVSVTYFGNIVIDSREEAVFGTNYHFKDRLSFFNQIIVSRKVTDAFSVQVAGSYSHFNCITETTKNTRGDTIGLWKNDYAGVMLGGRYKFYNNMSAIVEYSYPITINKAWEGQNEPKPNLGIGLEIGTSTHAFQIFASQYRGIIAQQNYSQNLKDMGNTAEWCIGFNITIRF
jgi:predicted porin